MLFCRLTAPLSLAPVDEPVIQRVQVYIQDEHAIKNLDISIEVARAATEKGRGIAMIRSESPNLVHVPYVMLMSVAWQLLATYWVTLVSEFSIAVNCMIAATAQLAADSRLTRAGHAFDQVVSSAHATYLAYVRNGSGADIGYPRTAATR
jgi:hypothetical protein